MLLYLKKIQMCNSLDLTWKEDDSETFLSAGKDGLLVMHFVENAHHPMNHVSDVAVDISPAGTVAVAGK